MVVAVFCKMVTANNLCFANWFRHRTHNRIFCINELNFCIIYAVDIEKRRGHNIRKQTL